MIQIKNLSFMYEDELVLKDISIDIEDKSYTAIIGANGSGKTTLAKHLNALLIPTTGTVTVDDIDTKKNQISARKKVGFVFQNPEDQIVYSLAEEDIAFGLENLGIEANEMRARVKNIMAGLRISRLAKKNVNMLSAGQKQLVALAGVMAMNPKYIVFDEPTTMLDSTNRKNIMDTIKNLNKKNKVGIILVTNVLEDIRYADNIVVLNSGKVIFNGKSPKLSKAIIKRAGLNV